MKTFKALINEKYINLFSGKDKYVDEVHNILQQSYKSIGGIKGSGFENKNAMMQKIKMWKLFTKDGKVLACLLYKDRNNMRKTVAAATDGSNDGKLALGKMLADDFERSSIEVSHSLLKFLEKKMPIITNKYRIKSKYVSDILNKPVKIIDDYHYERQIGNTTVTKMMLGNIKKFYE